jgi:hypothetical protein
VFLVRARSGASRVACVMGCLRSGSQENSGTGESLNLRAHATYSVRKLGTAAPYAQDLCLCL